ncbi:hypothetical protein QTV49_001694 [Vibrio vulnificus]|nr:hypothetical protein [Vibrio vulnificus]
MKKLFLFVVVVAWVSGVLAKSDSIDVLVINSDKMQLSQGKIEQLVKRKVEYNNRLFQRSNLLINRDLSSISYIYAPVEFGNLYMEATSLSLSASGLPSLFEGLGFSHRSLEKEVAGWLKEDSENYKVIFIPITKDSLECGMSFSSSEMSFSLMYLSETGQCARDWLLAHELGHQDGLVHEGEADSRTGGKCGANQSLMHSGINGDREVIFGNPNECAVPKVEGKLTPYEVYKLRSDENRKGAYKVVDQYKAPIAPIVISEIYEVNNMDVLGRLIIYNPTSKSMKGHLRLVDLNAPVILKNKSLVMSEVITANPSGVTYHEVRTTREKLLGYGSKMKISAEFDWY